MVVDTNDSDNFEEDMISQSRLEDEGGLGGGSLKKYLLDCI